MKYNASHVVHKNAPVAQWIEHLASDQGVVGSSPARRARVNDSERDKSVGW